MNPVEPLDEKALLDLLTQLCEDLAHGKPVDEGRLYALTREEFSPGGISRLAESFGLMLVKLEARAMHGLQLIRELQDKNRELELIRESLADKNRNLAEAVQKTWNTNQLLGHCPAIQRIAQGCIRIARHPINTMILGETGTGKEVVAKLIHYNSLRRDQVFLPVNCSAIPESLFESEMFGIEKGVATGVGERKGLLEQANGGTLFLDELADMSLPCQAKLLRALQDGEIRRVGGKKPIQVDVFVISATSQEIEEAIAEKRFRADLFYRLNVAQIDMPPLRERGEDVLILARHFLSQHARHLGRPPLSIASGAQAALLAYGWPGNVRELSNEMERLAALTVGDEVEASDLSRRIVEGNGTPAAAPAALPALPPDSFPIFSDGMIAKAEKQAVEEALAASGGNKTHAAQMLGITREGLRKKLKRMGIQ
jgi:DNA-binding NtrC family response regulator